jgi:type IX secretion system PorP/SprF family membrane protein
VQDAYSQQAPIFTQYYNTFTFSNPAYSGMSEGICVNGIYRQQWAGFKDANGDVVSPQDFLITIDSPVRFLHGGVGAAIAQDRLGQQSDIIVNLNYSFHLNLNIGTLGIGAGLNIINRSIDGSKFQPVKEDPILPKSEVSDLRLDANAGLFLSQPDRYYFGISVTNLLQTAFKKLDPSGEAIMLTDRTFYITGGYNFILPGNPLFEIIPSAFIISDLASTQYNISGLVKYNDKFWGGLNYRFQESIGVIAGVRFKAFKIGYSYDINTMGLGVPGSHEVGLSYCFKIKADRSKTSYKNTRYL